MMTCCPIAMASETPLPCGEMMKSRQQRQDSSCSCLMSPDTRIRKRIPKSCRRCHRRKQRCVGFPTCTGCDAAGQPCLRSETTLSWHHAMSKDALVQRIELLESKLDEVSTPSSDGGTACPSLARTKHYESTPSLVSLRDSQSTNMGPSSGRGIAKNIGRMVQDIAWSNSIPVDEGHNDNCTSKTGTERTVDPPDDELGSHILDVYFQNTHMRLPFIDRSKILDLHALRGLPVSKDPESQFDRFRLFMVYAIGAANLQITESCPGIQPTAFFETAIQCDPSVRESLTLEGAQAMTLLAIYNLRSSTSARVWYMIGLAMRICIDYGLHREQHYRTQRPFEAQLQRRLFWTVYVLERYTSWSLGRPFSIAEEEIDASLPADVDDFITDDEAIQRLLSNRAAASNQAPVPNLRRFISCVRLQRIMSRIHSRVYRVDIAPSALVSEISPLLASLEDYKESLPYMEPHETDFVHMHWHNCVRMLLQPILNSIPPQDSLIARCLHASGQMCQLFKRLRQRDSSGYSFLLVNGIFMAGLTMCFCLFRSPGLLTGSVSNDLRAASTALFIMAERDSNIKKYRDTLESLITRTMEFVNNPTSPSLLGIEDGSNTGNHQPGIQGHCGPSPGRTFAPWKDMSTLSSDSFAYSGPEYGMAANISYPFNDLLTEDFWTRDPLMPMNLAHGLNFGI